MTEPCSQTDNISKLKEKVALTNNDISYMKQEISEIKKNQECTNTKLDALIEKLDTKFASKWVEWVVKWLIGIVLLTVFGALLSTIIIK